MFYIYILHSPSFKRYYIGSTADLSRRLKEHNLGNTPSTKPFRPWIIAHSETFLTLHEAKLRELQIKSWKNPDYMVKTLGIDTSL